MKSMIGQYGKVVILTLAVMSLIIFTFSTGEDSFSGKMQVTTPEADYGKDDNADLMDEIAARKKPKISIENKKLIIGQYYDFIEFATVEFEDGYAANQTLTVKKIVCPNGDIITDKSQLGTPIRVVGGKYTVTYYAEENFKGAIKSNEKSAIFIADSE